MRNLEEKGRIWAEIDLDALIFNYRQAKACAEGVKTLAILKADAYGHGAVECARALEKEGADYFAVAAPEEALQLREAGIKTPLLLLGLAPDCMVERLAANGVELAVCSLEAAENLSRLAGERTVRVHVQLDTGMARLGVEAVRGAEQAAGAVMAIARLPHIELRGLYTHLCVADTREEDDFTRRQIALFKETAETVKAHGVDIPLCHCANSSAILRFPEARFDMVRAGIILYGVSPEPWMQELCGLRPVMSLRTRVMQQKTIAPGVTVGYGRTWKAPRETGVATIGVGYADGLMRLCSGKIEMLLHGRRVPQIGRICMDISMLDTTGIPCARGDIVTILGCDGEERISIEELAGAGDSVTDEILSNLSKRVPRLYLRSGEAAARTQYIG